MRSGSRRSDGERRTVGMADIRGRRGRRGPGVRRVARRPARRTATSATSSRRGGTTVKIRDGLMDVKALLAVERERAPAVAPRAQGRVPDRRRSDPRRVGGAAAAGARARARGLHGGAARGRADRAGHRRPRRGGPQASRALRDRRLHLGAHRRRRRRPDDPDDRGRDGGSGARRRRRPDARPRRLPQHRVPARARRAARRRRRPGTRSSTPARTRSSSTWRNATASGFRTLVDRAELTRLGEGLEAGGVGDGGRARAHA